MVSDKVGRSAYVLVKGKKQPPPFKEDFQVTSVTPIDINGNSIAALTESAQEQVYHAADVNLFGADRDRTYLVQKTPNGTGTIHLPPNYWDESLQQLYLDMVIGDPSVALLPDGSTITLIWVYPNGDQIFVTLQTAGSNFIFVKAIKNGKFELDKNGKTIGVVAAPPTTTASNSFTVPVFGPLYGNYLATIDYYNQCYASSSVTFPDGSTYTSGGNYPCF